MAQIMHAHNQVELTPQVSTIVVSGIEPLLKIRMVIFDIMNHVMKVLASVSYFIHFWIIRIAILAMYFLLFLYQKIFIILYDASLFVIFVIAIFRKYAIFKINFRSKIRLWEEQIHFWIIRGLFWNFCCYFVKVWMLFSVSIKN